MNNYKTFSPEILKTIKRYAFKTYRKLHQKIDLDDIQQSLCLYILQVLEKYELTKGNLYAFVDEALRLHSLSMYAYYRSPKRDVLKELLPSCPLPGGGCVNKVNILENIPTQTDHDSNLESLEIEIILDRLPPSFRKIAQLAFESSFFQVKEESLATRQELRILRKIIDHISSRKGSIYMKAKSISCLEILSVREISSFSIEDLHFLIMKVNQSLDWVKKIKAKLDAAL